MHKDVKNCADSRDIKGLHYIFVDSLDVDPTFEKYREDLEYCKNLQGFYEPYQELTSFVNSESNWNKDYWIQLKTDLLKNFSKERFDHMRQVAKVVFAAKFEMILADREAEVKEDRLEKNKTVNNLQIQSRAGTYEKTEGKNNNAIDTTKSIDELRIELEQENARTREEERRQKEELRRKREQLESNNREKKSEKTATKGKLSKNYRGIVLIILAVLVGLAAVVVTIIRMMQ